MQVICKEFIARAASLPSGLRGRGGSPDGKAGGRGTSRVIGVIQAWAGAEVTQAKGPLPLPSWAPPPLAALKTLN